MSELVAKNLHRIRLERGFSLSELSRRAGLSKQTLSSVEQGDANPTIDTIGAIALALDVPFRALVTEWGTATRLQRHDALGWRRVRGIRRAPLMQAFGSGSVTTELLELDPTTARTILPSSSTGTVQSVFVLAGRVEAGAEHELEILECGDHLTFPADRPHRLRALEASTRIHLTTTSPRQAQFVRD